MIVDENRNVSIQVLRPQTKSLICNLLNPLMLLQTAPRSNLRDWRGLFQLCNINPSFFDALHQDPDPTRKILTWWYENEPEGSTVSQLLQFLEKMERFDVIKDVVDNIDNDVETYRKYPSKVEPPNWNGDQYIVTRHDPQSIKEKQPLTIYDACLLYHEEDEKFASELWTTMKKQYDMKICVPDRDMVGGGFIPDLMVKLIIERCNRVIVVLSDDFFKSGLHEYYLKLAHAFGIEFRKRKIIPCVYKTCSLPWNMRYLYKVSFTQDLYDPYERLKDTVLVCDVD